MAATEGLESALAAAAYLDIRRNPFVAAVTEGRCSREVIRRYSVAVFALAERFPSRLAAVASICDDPEVRRSLFENLLEEEGITRMENGRLIRDDAKRHASLARRFAFAAGGNDDELRVASDRERDTATWLHQAIAARRAVGALAYLTVGIERSAPATLALIAPALSRHYGFGDADLEFFTSHIALDEMHGATGSEMIARMVRSDADRADAIDGARRGALAWWWFHRSMLGRER